jgi:hypothetical protein
MYRQDPEIVLLIEAQQNATDSSGTTTLHGEEPSQEPFGPIGGLLPPGRILRHRGGCGVSGLCHGFSALAPLLRNALFRKMVRYRRPSSSGQCREFLYYALLTRGNRRRVFFDEGSLSDVEKDSAPSPGKKGALLDRHGRQTLSKAR